jgi:RNA polymerase sigma factor for flagellar operon FliA
MRMNAATAAVAAASAPNLEERDALVMAHVDLVKSMANKLGRRVPSHVELSELVSVGVLGLIDAAQRYQPGLGVPFDAFARRRIHGAMLDSLRRLDRVPRSVRRLQRGVDSVLTELRHALGREPEAGEIAAAMGVSPDEYEGMLDDLRWAELAVIRPSSGDDDNSGEDLLDLAIDTEDGPYAQLERSELRAELARALGELPERERQILALSYEKELTLAEIGQVIGVGESRVSQLRTQAVARLRSMLQEWLVANRRR